MEAIIIALSPFITNALTGLIKGWTPFADLSDEARKPTVRILAAAVSLGYVMLGAWVTGNVDGTLLSTSVQGLVLAFVAWLASLGSFHAFFQKK